MHFCFKDKSPLSLNVSRDRILNRCSLTVDISYLNFKDCFALPFDTTFICNRIERHTFKESLYMLWEI